MCNAGCAGNMVVNIHALASAIHYNLHLHASVSLEGPGTGSIIDLELSMHDVKRTDYLG